MNWVTNGKSNNDYDLIYSKLIDNKSKSKSIVEMVNDSDNIDQNKITSIKLNDFLILSKLTDFSSKLKKIGCSEMEDILYADTQELIDIGFKKTHIKRLNRYLKKVLGSDKNESSEISLQVNADT